MIVFPFSFISAAGPPPVSDPDAQAFLTAAGVNNITQRNAVNNLVIDLKAENLWTLFDVIYPIVGGTANSHKYNLKNPLNSDEAFRLSFIGDWTHDSTGMHTDTQTAANRANTFYSPATNLASTSNSQVVYYTGDVVGLGTIGCIDQDTTPDSNFYVSVSGAGSRDEETSGINTFQNGALIIATRPSDVSFKYKAAYDNVPFNSVTENNTTGGTLPDLNYFLGATAVKASGSTTYQFGDSGTYGFIALGNGLGNSQSSTLAQIIEDYQVALSRNYSNVVAVGFNTSYFYIAGEEANVPFSTSYYFNPNI